MKENKLNNTKCSSVLVCKQLLKQNHYFITRLFSEKLEEEIIWISFNFFKHVVNAVLATILPHQVKLEPLYVFYVHMFCSSGSLGKK